MATLVPRLGEFLEALIQIRAECGVGNVSTVNTFSVFVPEYNPSTDSYYCRVLFSELGLDTRIVGDTPQQAIELGYRFANSILTDLIIDCFATKET